MSFSFNKSLSNSSESFCNWLIYHWHDSSICAIATSFDIYLGGSGCLSLIVYPLHTSDSFSSFTLMSNKHNVCRLFLRFLNIFCTNEYGFQFSVKNGILTVSPNLYSCKPVIPIDVMMLELWITLYLIPACIHLSKKSACVVAVSGSPTTNIDTFLPWVVNSVSFTKSCSQSNLSAY